MDGMNVELIEHPTQGPFWAVYPDHVMFYADDMERLRRAHGVGRSIFEARRAAGLPATMHVSDVALDRASSLGYSHSSSGVPALDEDALIDKMAADDSGYKLDEAYEDEREQLHRHYLTGRAQHAERAAKAQAKAAKAAKAAASDAAVAQRAAAARDEAAPR